MVHSSFSSEAEKPIVASCSFNSGGSDIGKFNSDERGSDAGKFNLEFDLVKMILASARSYLKGTLATQVHQLNLQLRAQHETLISGLEKQIQGMLHDRANSGPRPSLKDWSVPDEHGVLSPHGGNIDGSQAVSDEPIQDFQQEVRQLSKDKISNAKLVHIEPVVQMSIPKSHQPVQDTLCVPRGKNCGERRKFSGERGGGSSPLSNKARDSYVCSSPWTPSGSSERSEHAGVGNVHISPNSPRTQSPRVASNASSLTGSDKQETSEPRMQGSRKSSNEKPKRLSFEDNRHARLFKSITPKLSAVGMTSEERDEVEKILKKIEKQNNGTDMLTIGTTTSIWDDHDHRNRFLSRRLFSVNENDDNHTLDLAVGIAIVTNALAMACEMEWEGHRNRILLGLASGSSWEFAEIFFVIAEHCFNSLFLVEMVYRLWRLRLTYFKHKTYILDFCLVAFTTTQLYILDPLNVDSGGNLLFFRLLRFLRFVRVLKVIRMPIFAELRVMVKTCISSMSSLIWSMVLLGFMILMAGLFLCSLVKSTIKDGSVDYNFRIWLFRHYGSAVRAAYTLFEVTLSGCWPQYFRPLIEQINGWYGVFAVLYISIVVFAVIRIITATFLKETLKVATEDAEMMVTEQRAKFDKTVQKLGFIFRTIDVHGQGHLNADQFEAVIDNKDVKSWLQVLELEVHDARGLFDLLDNGEGIITYEEFLHGVLRLKGHARSLDVVAITRHCDRIEAVLLELLEKKAEEDADRAYWSFQTSSQLVCNSQTASQSPMSMAKIVE